MDFQDGELIRKLTITSVTPSADLVPIIQNGKIIKKISISNLLATSPTTPVAAGATKTLTAANAGAAILLDTASGSAVTLPAATGSGRRYRFVVKTTTTSGAHKILAASSSDFLNGRASGATAAGATLQFGSAAATNHSIQMPFSGSQPSGGIAGDIFEFQDIAANLWEVNGMYQAGTTATTPFSSSTT